MLLTACGTTQVTAPKAPAATPETKAELRLEAVSYSELPGWFGANDGAAQAAAKSCPSLTKRGTQKPVVTASTDWSGFCTAVQAGDFRVAAEQYLQPYKLTSTDDSRGLFTGYYEPLLKASRTPSATYNVPIYKRPADMVEVSLGDFRDSLKGQKITGRVDGRKLVPFYDRAAIARGALAGKGNELLWADSEADVFFLEIQGSGRAQLPDGSLVRIGYDAQNGHPYTAIGKILKEDGEIPPPITMPKIRDWLAAHPERQRDLFDKNPSTVFFRELKQDGAIGAANVVLTPEHSLAVDPAYYSYHLPLWVATTTPDGASYNRLMMAQDTGGAIRGPIRGDTFWGFGPRATEMAGGMQQQGTMYLLLPKGVEVP